MSGVSHPLFLKQAHTLQPKNSQGKPSDNRGSFLPKIIALIVTVIVVLIYDYLPKKQFDVFPLEENSLHLYSDQKSGGASRAQWQPNIAPSAWRCHLKESSGYPYCGFYLSFAEDGKTGVDLSSYDTVHLTLHYEGVSDRVRFYFRHYDPRFSVDGIPETAKINALSLRTRELNQPIAISIDEFQVPSWWVVMYDIGREHTVPDFSNVTTLGVDFGEPHAYGVHNLYLESVHLEGRWVNREQWYGGIILGWILWCVLWSIRHYMILRKNAAKDSLIIGEMSRVNQFLRAESDKYKELSTVDRLTGTLNRLGFEKFYDSVINTQESPSGHALIVTDIDHFKAINDQYGHAIGDVILKKMATIILSNTRQCDAVCRWGGEEFVIFCPTTNSINVYKLAEKIRMIVESTVFSPQHSIHVTASFGVGEIHMGEKFIEAFRRVDEALYDAKENGRNCTVVAVEETVY